MVSVYEDCYWTILNDTWFERPMGLWEPLFFLRGVPEVPAAQADELAEGILRDLLGQSLINLYRASDRQAALDEANDPGRRLSGEECEAALSEGWWRGPGNVYIAVTKEGHEAVQNPPEAVRAYWQTFPRNQR